jgi:hypothetical protein
MLTCISAALSPHTDTDSTYMCSDYRGLKKQLKEIRTSSPQSRSIDELTARSSKEALWVDIEVSSALESSAKPVPTILLTPACSTPMTMSRAPSLTSVSGNFSERQCTEAEMDAVKSECTIHLIVPGL